MVRYCTNVSYRGQAVHERILFEGLVFAIATTDNQRFTIGVKRLPVAPSKASERKWDQSEMGPKWDQSEVGPKRSGTKAKWDQSASGTEMGPKRNGIEGESGTKHRIGPIAIDLISFRVHRQISRDG